MKYENIVPYEKIFYKLNTSILHCQIKVKVIEGFDIPLKNYQVLYSTLARICSCDNNNNTQFMNIVTLE